MGRMKYFIILIVSGLLIIAEAMAYFLFVKPGMKLDDFFKSTEDGQYEKMAEAYDDLSEDDKDEAIQILKDKAVSITNAYLDGADGGQDAYTKMDDSLLPIALMAEKLRTDGDERMTGLIIQLAKCYYHANGRFLPLQYDICANAVNDDEKSKASEDAIKTFKAAYLLDYGGKGLKGRLLFDHNNIDQSYKDAMSEALIKYIEQKYQEFMDGKVSKKLMDAYLTVSDSIFETKHKQRLRDIREDVSEAKEYGSIMAECEGLFATQDYVKIIETIDELMVQKKDDPVFELYEASFKQQRNEAYAEGQEAYPDILYNYIKEGKLYEAKDLYEKIDKIYGSDIKLNEVKSFLTNEWKTDYYVFMQDWEENLRPAVENNVKVGEFNKSKDVDFASNKPDLMVLRDIDGDGTPEMILYNSRNSYSYILAWSNGRVVLTGVLKVVSYSNEKGYIISEPYSGNAGMASNKRELCYYDSEDAAIYTVKSIFRNRDYSYVYVDGTEYDKDGKTNDNGNSGVAENNSGNASPKELYDKAQQEIDNYDSGSGAYPDSSASVTISRYFECIYNYTTEEK